MSITPSIQRSAFAAMTVALFLCVSVAAANGQSSTQLPFAPGERFEYAGRVHVGVSGRGTLRVDGPNELRGTTVWALHSDMEGKLGFIRASDRAVSWFDPIRMSSLHYVAHERHLLAKHDDDVNIFPSERRWSAEDGGEGALVSEQPLDELSFLYYLRTLPLADEAEITVSRHFDAARNPTIVRVVGREDVDVGAGRFHAVVVEMRVRDARRYKGEGVIRIHLSDDSCRLILRLESNMPDAGKATLGLTSYEGMRATCTAKID